MSDWKLQRRIKYESELDYDFARQIESIPGGEHLPTCIQCGTCSATCPMSIYMDYTPRKIIAMTRAGFKEEVLRSFTIWLCSSCYSCSVECPKQIKITDLMYALKRKAIEEKVYPRRFPVPVLAREFFRLILSNGRSNERALIIRLYLKTNILRILKQAPVGLRLWTHGRLGLGSEKIKNKKQLQTLLNAVERGTS
jgi:quinone-modifying oxidoreductase subunit QmoC